MVREKLLEIQRKLGSLGNIVADGRDMGTVVFPEAILKIYLNAELKERAKRRWNDIKASGRDLSLEEVEVQLKKRDEEDSKRKHSPLRVPDGAFVIDSTDLTADQIAERVVELAENVIKSRGDCR
jgi:cytidylate kinase